MAKAVDVIDAMQETYAGMMQHPSYTGNEKVYMSGWIARAMGLKDGDTIELCDVSVPVIVDNQIAEKKHQDGKTIESEIYIFDKDWDNNG